MKFFHLVWGNLRRRKLRTALTLLSILVAFVLFGFLCAIKQALVVPGQQDSSSSRQERLGSDPWHGTNTFDQAVALARRGWPEGAAAALELRAEVDDVENEGRFRGGRPGRGLHARHVLIHGVTSSLVGV